MSFLLGIKEVGERIEFVSVNTKQSLNYLTLIIMPI